LIFTTSKHGPNQKIITIIRALSFGLLTFIFYGFITDYLGYGFSRVEASDVAIPADAVERLVTRIVDGDTVYTKDGTKIRLHGIDTPERDQPYGKQATRALDRLLKTKIFVLEKDTDKYGRLVAVLYTPEGLNVNLEMVCGGHAWWYERYAPDDRLLEGCENEAREAPKGLWEDKDPMPPWVWRRR